MKNLQEFFAEYELSHRNPTNRRVHKFAVPAIVMSTVLLLSTIKVWGIAIHAGLLFSLFMIGFSLRLSMKHGLILCVFLSITLGLGLWLESMLSLQEIRFLSLGVFAISWILQFWGHGIEGAKPSFAKDLVFLFIGPLWVIESFSPRTPKPGIGNALKQS